jgi:predicted RNA binding protein YcfA (HicA-like mRNA interferase family)
VVKKEKLYQRLVNNQKNVKFNQLLSIVEAFGFVLDRIKGSHHTYKHPKVSDAFLVLSADKNKEAKPYQVKQFLSLVEEHNLSIDKSQDGNDDEK